MKKIYIPLFISLCILSSFSIMLVSADDETNPENNEETQTIQFELLSDAPRRITQANGDFPEDARQAPVSLKHDTFLYSISQIEAGFLYEDFEAGVVPPSGWSEEVNNAGYNWKIQSTNPSHGTYYADVEYDPDSADQDEWLLSPVMTITQGTLTFFSFGSIYWCRDTNDNCDLNVWIVVDEVGGGDDIFVGNSDDDWQASYSWSQSIFELTPLLPGGAVRIGFEYVGNDGAQVALDSILLDNGLRGYLPLVINEQVSRIDEGFESGVVPPTDWTEEVNNSDYNWKIYTDEPHIGSYAADIEYDPNLVDQDEWLISPEIEITQGTLSFWSMGSLNWCRDVYDNCDLNIWIVVGDIGGGDDIFVGEGDGAWTDNYEWSQSTFDLSSLLPGGSVRIGFEYVGNDGAQIILDDITLIGE